MDENGRRMEFGEFEGTLEEASCPLGENLKAELLFSSHEMG